MILSFAGFDTTPKVNKVLSSVVVTASRDGAAASDRSSSGKEGT
jgi:hypothetical protein